MRGGEGMPQRIRTISRVLWFHEKCELDPNSLLDDEHTIVDLTDDEARAMKILETLHDTVDEIPPSLIKATEELRDAWPELFEKL